MIQHTTICNDRYHNACINLITALAISYQYNEYYTGTKNTKNFKKIKNLKKDIRSMSQTGTRT
jgi:hypothetical protein